ncbi:hypothetical protein F2P81_015224 [Scophthalmus maximus]|uniref:Uncharacterized protein n=1 Tax=Scophthalmus maximus TaxID=52904 RepID=A0A6A4SPE4_SCOMX|nr:hypothetical protein F2P81_015224 [Scophthalmus maximus]
MYYTERMGQSRDAERERKGNDKSPVRVPGLLRQTPSVKRNQYRVTLRRHQLKTACGDELLQLGQLHIAGGERDRRNDADVELVL